MILAEATINDLDLLTEMNIQLRSDEKMDNIMTGDEVRERMRGFLKGDIYKTFLLKDSSIVTGYALIDVVKNPFYLRQIYIKNDYRSRGLGSMFIDLVLDALNIHELDVEVMVWNERAIKFYEKYGFKKRYLGLRFKK